MNNIQSLKEVNQFINNHKWMDFELHEYKNGNLSIIGSTDFSYYHLLEIIFLEVSFIMLPQNWKTDTSKDVFYLVNETEDIWIDIMYKYEIEIGGKLFLIKPEYSVPDVKCFIVAKDIKYNTDIKYYYDRLPQE